MYIDEIEEKTIRGWMGFIRGCADLNTVVTSGSVTAIVSGSSYSLPNYNVLQETISFNHTSGSVSLVGYQPYVDGTTQQESVIMISGTSAVFTTNYIYSPVAILTRSRKQIDKALFYTPRLFVLWVNSASMPYRRQRNNNNKNVTRRRCYITLLIDVDDENGGYMLEAELTSRVWAAIENGRQALFNLGFEDIVVERIPTNEAYSSENPLEINHGVIMLAFTIYPEVK